MTTDRAVETGQRAEVPRKLTARERRLKYLLAMRELRKAEGTWKPEYDAMLGLEGLE